MDNLRYLSTVVVLCAVVFIPVLCHPHPKSECKWKMTPGLDYLSDSTEITVGVTDVQVCLFNCMNKTELFSCYTVRHNKVEQTCRYAPDRHGDLKEEDYSVNRNVDIYQLDCPGGILAIDPVYAALAGMGALVVLLFVTVIIIICVLSGNRK